MQPKQRLYDAILAEHLESNRQMAFVTGPRQVGKTTTCSNHAVFSNNWDVVEDHEVILAGPARLVEQLGLHRLRADTPVVLFDELHKYPRWKQFLKGFFDAHSDELRIIVTGSSRMDVYRRGGDSLMGRYFLYHMHPFSIAELVHAGLPDTEQIVRSPAPIANADFKTLWKHGGYPEPFLRRDARFSRRWQSLRATQLVREEIRYLTQVQQIDQMEMLVKVLTGRSSRQLIYGNLAKTVRVSVDSVRRWVDVLQSLHVGFLVRPWFKNVARSLRKEPKWYLRDWSTIADEGARAETFVACHLLKAVEGWTDLGLGDFGMGYLRDKEKREVDFVVTRDGKPWFIVEVKRRDARLDRTLAYYQDQLEVPHAFQAVVDLPYVEADCFEKPGKPIVVPARTLLSQLL